MEREREGEKQTDGHILQYKTMSSNNNETKV